MNSAAPDARGVSQARGDAIADPFRGYLYIAIATFCWAVAAVLALPRAELTAQDKKAEKSVDVLVYGSTPGGIVWALTAPLSGRSE